MVPSIFQKVSDKPSTQGSCNHWDIAPVNMIRSEQAIELEHAGLTRLQTRYSSEKTRQLH